MVDNTLKEDRIAKDLLRADQNYLPVNLIYPPNYPEEPAILLNELIWPSDALLALERMEKIQQKLKGKLKAEIAKE